MAFDLESIATLLDRHHQRATYAAVADLLGVPARSLMSEAPKRRLYSWVVNAQTKKPTRYPASAVHPDLFENATVLTTAIELGNWIRSKG